MRTGKKDGFRQNRRKEVGMALGRPVLKAAKTVAGRPVRHAARMMAGRPVNRQ